MWLFLNCLVGKWGSNAGPNFHIPKRNTQQKAPGRKHIAKKRAKDAFLPKRKITAHMHTQAYTHLPCNTLEPRKIMCWLLEYPSWILRECSTRSFSICVHLWFVVTEFLDFIGLESHWISHFLTYHFREMMPTTPPAFFCSKIKSCCMAYCNCQTLVQNHFPPPKKAFIQKKSF